LFVVEDGCVRGNRFGRDMGHYSHPFMSHSCQLGSKSRCVDEAYVEERLL
jgi:hypothetical protein